MTEKDYKAIAEIIKYIKEEAIPPDANVEEQFTLAKEVIKNIVKALAFYFESTNSHFDWDNFVNACGFKELMGR